MGRPLAGSHSRTVLSLPALASWRPSGENATPLTDPAWPVEGGGAASPLAGSHSRTVWSPLLLASWRPSGENATLRTQPSWPVRVPRCSPVAGSHSRTSRSSLALASWRPSGENATACTGPWWPSSTRSTPPYWAEVRSVGPSFLMSLPRRRATALLGAAERVFGALKVAALLEHHPEIVRSSRITALVGAAERGLGALKVAARP